MRTLISLLVAWTVFQPVGAYAGGTIVDPALHPAMSHRHGVELGVGLLSGVSSGTSVGAGGVSVEADGNGLMGAVTYLYRLDDNLVLTMSGGGLSVDASVWASGSTSAVESSSVSMFLVGLRYQFPGLDRRGAVRPYASLGVGPYIGVASNVRAGATTTVESRTEAAPGGRLGVGLTAGLNSWLTMGVGVGYHLVGDFSERIGAETNYSNPDFLLAFGVRYGAIALE